MTSRFYYRFTTAAPVSPTFDAAWTNTTGAVRRYLAPARLAADTLTGGDARTWSAGEVRLDRQYVSDRMEAGIVFTGAAVRSIIAVLESNADDNAFSRLGVRVCNGDGTVIRATLLAVADYSNAGTEYATSTATRRWAEATVALCSAYVTEAGDRLVVEVGHSDATGTSPSATAIYGSASVDDHSSVGSSSGFNPWIDFNIEVPLLASTAGSVGPYTVSPYTVNVECQC